MNLQLAMLIDTIMVGVCAALLLKHPAIRFAHPATIYVLFHFAIVTFRGWAVAGGVDTFLNVPSNAFPPYILIADVFLFASTIGWLGAGTPTPGSPEETRSSRLSQLDSEGVYRASITLGLIAVPLGLYSLAKTGYVPGVTSGAYVEISTSYQIFAILWPALIGLALVYCRGPRAALLLFFFSYIGLMAVQGQSRFRFLLPLIMLLVILLDQRERRWPSLKLIPLALIALMHLLAPEAGREGCTRRER